MEEWIKYIIGLVGAIGSFGFGVYQYRRAQHLKQIDNLLNIRKDIEEFVKRPGTQTVFTLTDYNSWVFNKYPYESGILSNIYLNDEVISYCLRVHGTHSRFHAFETHIRTTYDEFFTQLEMYYYYVKIGLFDVDFLRPYVGYYLHILADPAAHRKSPEYVQALHNYMAYYYPHNLCKLLKLFGYTIHYKPLTFSETTVAKHEDWLKRTLAKLPKGAESAAGGSEESADQEN